MWKWARWRRVTVNPVFSHFGKLTAMTRGTKPSHFGTQADVALCAVRVPRPAASSFTYRRRAPRRPVSASMVCTQRTCNRLSACLFGLHGTECMGSRVIARKPCRLPLTVGWMVPGGKGGARAAGGGHGRNHLPRWQRRAQASACSCTPMTLAYKDFSKSPGSRALCSVSPARCAGSSYTCADRSAAQTPAADS